MKSHGTSCAALRKGRRPMPRPLTPLEKELARALVLTETHTTWALALGISKSLPEHADAVIGAHAALKLVYGLLRAIGVTPECREACCPCLLEYRPASPSHATRAALNGCLNCAGLSNEPIAPETAPCPSCSQFDATQFRRLLVSAYQAGSSPLRPSTCTQQREPARRAQGIES